MNKQSINVIFVCQPRKMENPKHDKDIDVSILEGSSRRGQDIDGGWILYFGPKLEDEKNDEELFEDLLCRA